VSEAPGAGVGVARTGAITLALAGLLLGPLGPAAGAALGVALLWAAARPALRPAWTDPGFVLALGLGLALLVFGGLAFWQSSALVDGHRWWWLEDDALVSMRYGARLAAGKGLTWTGVERVEGYSDFLWTLAMALIHALGAGKAWASFWVLALEGACLAWLALATRSLARALGAEPLPAALAGAAIALSFDQLAGALSGLEPVAVAAVCAQALAWAASARPALAWRGVALASLLPLLRADGALAAVLVLALAWPRLGVAPKRAWAAALLLAPGLAHLLWRHAYYGAWLPNTYTLKAGSWPGKWSGGAWAALQALRRYPLVLAMGLSAFGRQGLRPWAAACAVLLAYCAWTGADYYDFLRFFAPGWPLLFALAFAALGAWGWSAPRQAWLGWALLLLSYNAYAALPELARRGWDAGRERMELALQLRPQLAHGGKLASAWAGAFYYYSDAEGVDLLGKCDTVVAHCPPNLFPGGVGHNKMDLAWSLGVLKPDWVLFEPPVPVQDAYGIDRVSEAIVLAPLFRRHCLDHSAQVSPHWALCHCDWSLPDGPAPVRRGKTP
jgi:hypothetical protein